MYEVISGVQVYTERSELVKYIFGGHLHPRGSMSQLPSTLSDRSRNERRVHAVVAMFRTPAGGSQTNSRSDIDRFRLTEHITTMGPGRSTMPDHQGA